MSEIKTCEQAQQKYQHALALLREIIYSDCGYRDREELIAVLTEDLNHI